MNELICKFFGIWFYFLLGTGYEKDMEDQGIVSKVGNSPFSSVK